ncbi:hypothetical protein R6Q57_029198 [Mikania cordata]
MGSTVNAGAGDKVPSTGNGNGCATIDKDVDFANYFCTYAFLYHQKDMLSDRTGSGILAIWSAQAGAKKVYAVEATKMAKHAHELVKANNLQYVAEVIEGSIEDITLPEKVDVLISEWMGYFLLRESMFDSVICARDRWLKPTGVMYPSHARMWMAPIRSEVAEHKMSEYEVCMDDWHGFVTETKSYYGVDTSVLTKPFSEEQKKYYLQNSLWNNLDPNQVVGTATILKEIDCLTVTVDDIIEVKANISSTITKEDTRLCGFGGWFDVHFNGRTENPAECEVELTTAPSIDYGTHWGQQVFLLHPPVRVNKGDGILVNFLMNRSKENHQLMNVDLGYEIKLSSGRMLPPVRNKFYIE